MSENSNPIAAATDSGPAITVVQHQESVPLGLLTDALAGARLHIVRPDAGEPLPGAEGLEALIVLGGSMAAHDEQDHPWLAAERDLLSAAVQHGVPTLAVCLGAQQLAMARGGQVEKSAPTGPEQGVIEVRMRPDAVTDPVLGPVVAALGRDIPAPSMHADAVTALPAEATWLASSQQYPFQAFRVGSAVGVQFHPEAGEDVIRRWAENRGLDVEEVTAGYRPNAEALTTLVTELGAAFLAQIADRSRLAVR
ncbi:type 1 glutamine amidotransferase [Ruania zhangjianzhongii]|uniref:type 1 glutamine amidotransferase n=1 Tax=Ruania zhangjianzhongii TaxID=2603206 RepID=UPI001F27CC39|nr:type 1 glutamine amidotransferase [Ruania zhangjianzhongii]